MTREQKATVIAIRHFFSNVPSDEAALEIAERLWHLYAPEALSGDLENVTVWAPFENYGTEDLAEAVEVLRDSILAQF